MSRFNLRQKPRISYYEPEEPNLDEYLFCSDCADYVFEYCAIHGPLLVIPDNKVPEAPNYPSFIPRSALTIPDVFLHLAPSTIPGAGIGVFSTLTLPKGVRFGPYTGKETVEVNSMYCWQLYGRDNKPSHVVDASDASSSNWMRYVNCSRRWQEQNLLAYQYQGQLYYRTVKIIPKCTELLVFYGSKFAHLLDINLRYYNSPTSFAVKFGAQPSKKQKKSYAAKENDEKNTNNPDNNIVQVDTHKIPFVEEKQVKPQTDANLKNTKVKGKTTVKRKKNQANQKEIQPKCFTDDGKKPLNKTNDNVIQNNSCEQSYCNSDSLVNAKKRFADKNEVSSKHIDSFYITCTECNYRTTTGKLLSRHMNLHDLNRKFKCKDCGLRYKSLKTHFCAINISDKPYTCSYCDRKFTHNFSLTTHLRTHTGEKPYTCSYCDRKFTHNFSLTRHLRTHTGEKPYTCSYCDRKFTNNSNLTTHLRTHTGEKPYTCSYCDRKFTHNSNLTTHLRTHTGEKPYTCSYCDRKFTNNSDLTTHLRTHTGEKPYTCSYCDRKFTHNISLTRHLRTHTGEKPYTCSYCDRKFTNNSNLTKHLRTHTGEKPYK